MTTSEIETQCREFAAWCPQPNVLEAIRLAEAGRVTWTQVYNLFTSSLDTAVAAL